MKALVLATALALGVALVVGDAAAAQIEDTASSPENTTINLFSWYESGPDWELGLLLASLGLAGSLATVFTLVRGAIPGSPGQGRIDTDAIRLEKLYGRLEDMLDDSPMQAPMVKALEATINNLRDDLRKERWRQYFVASLVYALGGALFAAALARDMTQAIVIGAGWTSFLGAVGIKSDTMFRFDVKDGAIDKLSSRLGALVKAQPAIAADAGGADRLDSVMREATIARALTRR
jgi:hypothetical protein